MPTQKFAYSSLSFIIWGVVISVFFVFFLVVTTVMSAGIDIIWVGGILALYVISLLIFSIMPIMARHEISDEYLLISQGLLFRKKIEWSNIEEITTLDDERMSSGVYASVRRPRVIVTSRRFNLILIRLREKERFGFALGKLADEIIIDVRDTERFVAEVKEHLGQ